MTELGYKTLRESIVDIIRKRIINRELQPGQKVVEQELAKEFKTSRAPSERHCANWRTKVW